MDNFKEILDGRYTIYDTGIVIGNERKVLHRRKKSTYIKKSCDIKHQHNGNGYKYVTLCCNGKRKNYYVHRLVAENFLPERPGFYIVNHKDGNKSNNHVSNLEWCNHSENMIHAYKNGLNRLGDQKPNAIKVFDHETGTIFGCIKDASFHFNIKYGLLKEALKRDDLNSRNPIYKRLRYYNIDK